MALAQAARIIEVLARTHPGITVETIVVSTHGDRWMGSLTGNAAGGKGAFVREIDSRLVDGEIDVAVHCLKDIPGDVPTSEGLVYAAFLEREDAHDCLVTGPETGWKIADAPAGTVIGTSSVRRRAQIARRWPQLRVQPMRGNVNTRLAKLDERRDGVDALILAVAGLHRIDQAHRIVEVLDLDVMAPPVGAGILVAQTRADDTEARALLAPLNDPVTESTANAERAVLAGLQGHCNSPITGHAAVIDSQLTLRAAVYAQDGSRWIETTTNGPATNAAQVGASAAQQLLDQGARELIDAIPH